MSKWNKPQGVVVPLESLLKERRKENCPAPRRSAGLVGRWGITSFTSIRNRNYVADYNNVDLKESLELATADTSESMVNLLTPVQDAVRPRKFFKSRNTVPPLQMPTDHHHQQQVMVVEGVPFGAPPDAFNNLHHNHQLANSNSSTPPQPPQYYQPLSAAATPQLSPTGPQAANVGTGLSRTVAEDEYAPQQQQQQAQRYLQNHDQPYSAVVPTSTLPALKPGTLKKTSMTADLLSDSMPDAPLRRGKGGKKEKKDKKAKKSKAKEPAVGMVPGLKLNVRTESQPKRNSSRIRNRVVNYNEDDDSNDYQRTNTPYSTTVANARALAVSALHSASEAMFSGSLHSISADQNPEVSQSMSVTPSGTGENASPTVESGTDGGRASSKPSTNTYVTTPLASPSNTEHRPILLRISKGTSMLISTDSEDVSSNSGPAAVGDQLSVSALQEIRPSYLANSFSSSAVYPYVDSGSCDEQGSPTGGKHKPTPATPRQSDKPEGANCPSTDASVASSVTDAHIVPKTELKIRISLGGKPLISTTATGGAGLVGSPATSTTTSNAVSNSKTNKAFRYNFKKHAIERERARHHLSSKRIKSDSKAAIVTEQHVAEEGQEGCEKLRESPQSTVPGPPATRPLPVLGAGNHDSSAVSQLSSTVANTIPVRPSFPLPGTDTYEVFRTLSSLSGGDDFDSQSSILGSASSDNTPKHTLTVGEDHCQIIHSRGSSDCGSDLELSQNSSMAAAPPSDACSESETTQDNNRAVAVGEVALTEHRSSAGSPAIPSSSTVADSAPLFAPHQTPSDRVEVLKINLKNTGSRSNCRVTRNKMKTTADDLYEGAATAVPTTVKRTARTVRNRTNNQNNNNVVVVASSTSVSEKKSRNQLKAPQSASSTLRETSTAQAPGELPTATHIALCSPDHSQDQQQPHQVEDTTGAQTDEDARNGSVTGQGTLTSGLKLNITRQYSRRKKNVVPPDYLSDTKAGNMVAGATVAKDISLKECDESRANATTLPTDEPFEENGRNSVSSMPYTALSPFRRTPDCGEIKSSAVCGNISSSKSAERQTLQDDSVQRTATVVNAFRSGGENGITPEGTVSQPAPPMRLVLQKKGTIFKSRPLISSSQGVPEGKKRHVYKHKWDNEDGGNGVLEQDEQSTTVGSTGSGIVAGSNVGGGGEGGSGVPSISGSNNNSTIGGTGDTGRKQDAGAGNLMTSTSTEHGPGNAAGVGCGGVGSGNMLDFDNDFLECESTSSSQPAGLPSRAKRQKFGSHAGLSAGGGLGSTGGGITMASGETFNNVASGLRQRAAAQDEHEDYGGGGFGDSDNDGGVEVIPKLRCYRDTKPFYTIVRNVKNSHQMQEIGEFQEMDDDVEYILSALQPDNPVSTRCLSALQLATKCMKPAFKMHVRAHGVVTRFFQALSDAHHDASLALCTAAIMYVFSQDKLNMDLDRDSLELMLNLLNTVDHEKLASNDQQRHGNQQAGGQQQKIRQRVKELCGEIKGCGKMKHIDTERHISAGSLAMESLLSLTSQRAGEWFKDELRNLGGIEHLIKTVAGCYQDVPARASEWHEDAVAKLRKIERCLRVLNNVCVFNRANQLFLLEHCDGLLVKLLSRLFRQLDVEITQHVTNDQTPKDATGVLVRELYQPILHMFITLTHSLDEEAHGANIIGQQPEVINISMHILLRFAEYVPPRCVFDLHLLALTLLLHLARRIKYNRKQILCYKDEETGRGGITSLVEYFEQQEEMASYAEAKTNAILETPVRTVDTEDTETRLMQKAEHHMEHTYMGSHVCMLIFYLVSDEPSLEELARAHLKNRNFQGMVAAMSRYYEFLNLTTNADAESTAHKRQTKEAIDYFSQLDGCESGSTRVKEPEK
ncbi:protein wings apart-like [Anopheles cruzii]|uniref:protein wings apart-like n=1 Tax=Anopheles cruzii TaxID=68878 RepID=UPI0022EC9138|nr:protein wings apart-like [Anopheles cruzii]